jgi:uncharacterized protein
MTVGSRHHRGGKWALALASVLGALPFPALADAPPGSAVLPRGPAAREAVVHVATLVRGPGVCGGDHHPLTIRVDPSSSGHLQLGFFETRPNAIGPQFRATGWMAGVVAATVLGRNLNAHRISYTYDEGVEGPSAGALTTAALLALMRGQAIAGDAAMTGTVNPDGTVGPVGGIAQKIAGAHPKTKRFGIPRGARMALNQCTGKRDDLVELGRARQIEVVEIGDVREAYQLLTGHLLPASPITPLPAQMPADIREAYRKLFERWMARYTAAAEVVRRASPAEFHPDLKPTWSLAERLQKEGRADLAKGHEAAAFSRAWLAVLNAEVTARAVLGMREVFGGLDRLQAAAIDRRDRTRRHLASELRALGGLKAATAVDAGALLLMGGQVTAALTHVTHAERLLGSSTKTGRPGTFADQTEAAKLAFEAIAHFTIAESTVDAAVLTKGWLGRGGPALDPGLRGQVAVLSAAQLFQAAALANIEYFDALVTREKARARGVDLDVARNDLERADVVYLNARGGLVRLADVGRVFGEGSGLIFAQIGGLAHTVSNSSLLVAQHYSLRARTDGLGLVVGFEDEPALAHMTRMAEQEALRAVGEAAAATRGASTPMLAAGIEAARRSREASVAPPDRLLALSIYWTTTFAARLVSQLSPGP